MIFLELFFTAQNEFISTIVHIYEQVVDEALYI